MPAQVAVPVRPSDPPFMNPLSARTNDGWENPRRWGNRWSDRRQAGDLLWEAFHRTDANGDLVQRIILEPERRSVDAAGEMGVGPGADWTAIDPFLKQLIINVTMERRKEDRAAGRDEITVGFYNGYLNNGMAGLISNHTADGVVDLRDDRDLEQFKTKWEPWIECGVLSELNHDAGVKAWDEVKELLLQQYTRFGLYGLTEAIRWDRNDGIWPTRYDWSQYEGVDMWCISRYMLSRDPTGQLAWPWSFRGGEHDTENIFGQPASVWMMNSTHTYVNHDGETVRGLMTTDEVHQYVQRGWGVGSWNAQGDYAVNLNQGPTPDPSGPGVEWRQ